MGTDPQQKDNPNGAINRVDELTERQYLELKTSRNFFKTNLRTAIASLANAFFVGPIIYPEANAKFFAQWYLALVLVLLARLIVVFLVNKGTIARSSRSLKFVVGLQIASGVLWSLALFLTVESSNVLVIGVIFAVIAGNAAGMAAAASPSQAAAIAYQVPTVSIVIVYFWLFADQPLLLSIIFIGFGSGALGLSAGVKATVNRSLRNEYYIASAYEKIQSQSELLTKMAKENQETAAAERQARQAESRFLAKMSHELRTPLNAIIGFSDFIIHMGEKLPREKTIEYSKDVKSTANHLLGVINDILDLAQVESGQLKLQEVKLNLVDLVGHCIDIVKPLVDQSGLQVSMHAEAESIMVYADERRLKQITFNLLGNSIKFTDSPGEISVHLRLEENGNLIMVVADSGVGIPKERLEDVTKPFVQDGSGPQKSAEGTGLGLATVKEMVEAHQGKFWLESEVGKGTHANVQLPAVRVIAP